MSLLLLLTPTVVEPAPVGGSPWGAPGLVYGGGTYGALSSIPATYEKTGTITAGTVLNGLSSTPVTQKTGTITADTVLNGLPVTGVGDGDHWPVTDALLDAWVTDGPLDPRVTVASMDSRVTAGRLEVRATAALIDGD